MMNELLQRICRSLGIEYTGIAPVGPYIALKKRIEARIDKGHYTEFEEQCIAKRIDPKLTMEDTESVIVCLFPYYTGQEPDGNIATYAYGLDYHRIIKDKLEQIGEQLAVVIPDFHYQAFVDTGPLVDRYMAYLAGIGFYGLNGHIITDSYGSYVLIGYMLTNYPFESGKPLQRTCMQCNRCITACPGEAIIGDFTIDPRCCRSYLSQKKGELPIEEQRIMKKSKLIFGCDICQQVCPHNEQVAVTAMREFQEHRMPYLDDEELKAISNKEFIRRYGNRAFSWRGRKLLVRNSEYVR